MEDYGGRSVDESNLVLDDDGPMSFYATDFPPLPDFPCMSSSSSSSSNRAPVKGTSSSLSASSSTSSSTASWAFLRSDQDVDRSPDLMAQQPVVPAHQPGPAATVPVASALSSTASMDMMMFSENIKMEDVQCEEDEEEVGLEDCVDMMESFGYMDLLECNDLFDPASIFQSEEPGADPTIAAGNNGYPIEEFDQVQHQLPVEEQPEQNFQQPEARRHP